LARLGDGAESAEQRAEVHLRLARAAVAAARWDEAQRLVEDARRETSAAPHGALAARLDVLRAQIAMERDPQDAPMLARAALDAAQRFGVPEVACEALEILGRALRPHDLAAAEETFARALTLAQANDLLLWRARALQELGAIDMLRGRPLDRLDEARELALALGALTTAAVVDVQAAAGLVLSDDPEAGAAAARRSADLARRYHFDQTLAAAVAMEAYAHARLRRRAEMLGCIEEARALAAGVPDIEVKTSTAMAIGALVDEDRATARHYLCAGLKAAARGGDYSVVPAVGLLALLRQLDGPDDEAPEIQIPPESVHFMTSSLVHYADAVAAGRAGDPNRAAELAAEADHILEHHRWLTHLGRRLVAEVAVADEWGDPVGWLREALDFFDQLGGGDRIASACRSLLRRAGAPVPRRREHPGVPGELRTLGVTARELEVLQLLALGLANQDIAARLFLSPRTVERHVANLAVKTGATRRSELVAYAARTLGAGIPSP
jgi:DNA-binding CsgD family transcriptional regulator